MPPRAVCPADVAVAPVRAAKLEKITERLRADTANMERPGLHWQVDPDLHLEKLPDRSNW